MLPIAILAAAALRGVLEPAVEPDLDQSTPPVPMSLALDAALGSGVAWDGRSRLALDATARLSLGHVVLGAVASEADQIFGNRDTWYGALAGIRHPLSPRWTLEVLGEVGRHELVVSEEGLFGASGRAATAYAGARVGVSASIGGALRLVAGAWALVRGDLERRRVLGSGAGVFGPPSTEPRDLGAVGGAALLLMGRIGGEFQLGGG